MEFNHNENKDKNNKEDNNIKVDLYKDKKNINFSYKEDSFKGNSNIENDFVKNKINIESYKFNDNIKESNKLLDKEKPKIDLKSNLNISENKNSNNTINKNKEDIKNCNEEKIITKIYRKEISIKDWGCRNLDSYNIIKNPVGEGTFGTVFKAYYKGPEDYAKKLGIPKIVALKKIKTDNEKQGFPITALREIMVMKRLHHKNILQLLEVLASKPSEKDNDKRFAYLVFEYMEHDLFSLIQNNFFYEKSQIKFILYQLLQGLKYLHQNHVLHRDIKPANILINNKGEVKIGDFGLSRIFSELIKNKRYTNRVVTICYRAPELLLGENNYGPAIDVWSIGCVLWEIITGEILFYGKDEKEVFLQICKECGTPSENIWQGIKNLPFYSDFIPKDNYECKLNTKYKNYNKFDDTAFDLFMKMICFDPKKRITIEDSLNHPYFFQEPKMCEEKDMPKIEEDFHRYSKIKKEHQKQQLIGKGDYNKGNSKNFIGKKRNHK